MSKRLVKVAKELNVGTKTIVNFLVENGFSVSNKPTAKISDEMFDMLSKNFQSSVAIKEKANKITIGFRKNKENSPETEGLEDDTKSSDSTNVDETSNNKEKEDDSVVETTEDKKEEKEEKPAEKVDAKLPGPKVLGKIDLDDLKKKPKKKNVPSEKVKEKEEEKVSKEVTSEEVKEVKEKKEVKDVKEVKEVKKEKEVSKEVKAEELTDNSTENVTIKEAPQNLDIEVEAPQLKGLKILGKINIASPKSKNKKGRKKEDSNTKKTGENSDKGQKKRRKRTRVNKKSNGEKTSKNENKSSETTKKDGAKVDSKKQFKTPNKESQGSGANKKVKKKGKRKAVDQKEVGSKLKQTMNLLGGGGGRKKKFGASRKERDEQRAERLKEIENSGEETPTIQVTEFISVSELASMMNVGSTEIIMACMREKRMVSINQRLDRDLIELMGIEFGYEVEFVSAEDQMEKDYQIEEDDLEDIESRSPIVTVMGHVDHGKTSLLDSIRKANVADSEAGGITQHIGAYVVSVADSGTITFLDTPGHEAFTAMRARGAKVTDIAVIIISADDNIMPQTKEAISHAKAAEVPIIFAINKIDKEGANPDRIKQELATMDLLIEEWGGSYQSQDISAKNGTNIDLLLEKILLEAEMLELMANPEKRAAGTVLEASLEKGRGYVTKILVRNGTLKIGDAMVAGPHYGRVKAMFDERGKRVKSAGPATPVLVLGLQGAPQAGETVNVLSSEKAAKDLTNKRANLVRQQQIRATRRVTLDDITNRIKIGNFKELNLIVKGDFDGSVEALADSLQKLSTDQIQTNIIYKAVGPVTESDVNLAAASDAIIVGFQVRPNPMAKRLAEKEGVEVKSYSIIYDAIDEIKSALEGMLEPKQIEEVLGMVDVQEVFKISKVGMVAGCLVQEGKVLRNSYIRVIRGGIVQFPKKEGVHGELSSLKRFKDSVPEVKQGHECGITIKNYNDIKAGDVLEVYEVKEVKQTL